MDEKLDFSGIIERSKNNFIAKNFIEFFMMYESDVKKHQLMINTIIQLMDANEMLSRELKNATLRQPIVYVIENSEVIND